jgi:hypothetical protein
VIKKLNIFFGILLATNVWSNEQTIPVEGLSCSANDPDKLVELWSLDSWSKTVSYWSKDDFQFREFPTKKFDQKIIAWEQKSDFNLVYVLDRTTMRQSGTKLFIDKNGGWNIEKRWVSQCQVLTLKLLNKLIEQQKNSLEHAW